MKLISIIATAAALALAATACGGSSRSDADFVKDFNAAEQPLENLVNDVTAAQPDPSKAESPQQYDQLMGSLIKGFDSTSTKLRALEPPQDAKAEYDAFLTELDRGRDALRELHRVVRAGKVDKAYAAGRSFGAEMARLDTAQEKLLAAVDG